MITVAGQSSVAEQRFMNRTPSGGNKGSTGKSAVAVIRKLCEEPEEVAVPPKKKKQTHKPWQEHEMKMIYYLVRRCDGPTNLPAKSGCIEAAHMFGVNREWKNIKDRVRYQIVKDNKL